MKNHIIYFVLIFCCFACSEDNDEIDIALPPSITLNAPAQGPEGIEYDQNTQSFLLSSVNGLPIIKVDFDGTVMSFANGEAFPLSTAGLHIDNTRNRLLAAAFNGLEAFDTLATTVGQSNLRIYDLETGLLEQDILLSDLSPGAFGYFANDLAVDDAGNVYVSDWFANVIYRVDINNNASLFWENPNLSAWPNGMDFHPDGYLLVSLINDNYSEYGFVKIPIVNPQDAQNVVIPGNGFSGFDGMVINEKGNVIGVTNDGTNPGGNLLIELMSSDDWVTASIVNSRSITPSTTVAIIPNDEYYVINQDFQNNSADEWTIEKIEF